MHSLIAHIPAKAESVSSGNRLVNEPALQAEDIYMPLYDLTHASVFKEKNDIPADATSHRNNLSTFIQRKVNQSSVIHGIASGTPIIQRQPRPVPLTPLPIVTPVITQRYRPTGSITRTEFDNYVRTHFGVADIHTGTQQEQEQRSTRRNTPAVTIPSWQRWDPGTASDDYTSIINGIENMADALGAIPTITSITFFKVFYEPDATTGVGVPDTTIGATFGAGSLTIFEAFSGSTYPAIGINTPAGAPTALANRERDIAHTITHELGHGVAEAAMASQNNQTFVEFRAAVGWIGSPEVLYDIGQPTVRAAIASQTQPPVQHRITPSRWFDNTVSEQPMSRYAIDGGPSEDFAESIAAFIENPSVLQQRSPARYNFIRNNINTWRTRMRATMPARVRPPVGDFPIPDGDSAMA